MNSQGEEIFSNVRSRWSRRREEGQSLVELALVVPLFILLLIGSTEFARFAWAAMLASSAARAGAQFANQNHITASDSLPGGGIETAAKNDAINITGLKVNSSTYCVCSTNTSTVIDCTTTLTGPTCAAPATILEFVQVNTSVTVTPLGNYPGLPTTFTARGQSIMEVEQ